MFRRPAAIGFTLIELLVVVAVIAIIAAILFPVFAQVREKARSAACLSNLKQMGAAWMMYAQDYDEMFSMASPGGNANWAECPTMKDRGSFGGWIGNLLIPYSKNAKIFACPSNPTLNLANDGYGWCAGPHVSGGADLKPNRHGDEALARQRWGIPYLYVSYGYNYVSLWNTGLASVARPADQIAIYDSIFPWTDCPYAQ